jgi:hypothetical protein
MSLTPNNLPTLFYKLISLFVIFLINFGWIESWKLCTQQKNREKKGENQLHEKEV